MSFLHSFSGGTPCCCRYSLWAFRTSLLNCLEAAMISKRECLSAGKRPTESMIDGGLWRGAQLRPQATRTGALQHPSQVDHCAALPTPLPARSLPDAALHALHSCTPWAMRGQLGLVGELGLYLFTQSNGKQLAGSRGVSWRDVFPKVPAGCGGEDGPGAQSTCLGGG